MFASSARRILSLMGPRTAASTCPIPTYRSRGNFKVCLVLIYSLLVAYTHRPRAIVMHTVEGVSCSLQTRSSRQGHPDRVVFGRESGRGRLCLPASRCDFECTERASEPDATRLAWLAAIERDFGPAAHHRIGVFAVTALLVCQTSFCTLSRVFRVRYRRCFISTAIQIVSSSGAGRATCDCTYLVCEHRV